MANLNLASADTDFPTPNAIDCLKVIEPLDPRYRSRMQQQCLVSAGKICMAIDNGTGSCLPDLVTSMRTFNQELLLLLPPEIDGKSYEVTRYKRALERAADTLENISECSELDSYELTTCEFIELGVVTLDLFYRARLADTPLP